MIESFHNSEKFEARAVNAEQMQLQQTQLVKSMHLEQFAELASVIASLEAAVHETKSHLENEREMATEIAHATEQGSASLCGQPGCVT